MLFTLDVNHFLRQTLTSAMFSESLLLFHYDFSYTILFFSLKVK